MKKTLLIAACAGAFLAFEAPLNAMMATATPETQILGAATVATIGLGTTIWTIGHFGAANTIGTAIAGSIGCLTGWVTHRAIEGLIATELCPVFLAANPMVAPIALGATVGGLMFWLRKQYLSGHSKELEEFGSVLLKAGIALGNVCAISYIVNIFNGTIGSPFRPKV